MIGGRRLPAGVAAFVVVAIVLLGFTSSASAAGPLTFQGCLTYTPTPANGCAAIPTQTLRQAYDVVISADGEDVYVTSAAVATGAVTHFKRGPSGILNFADCVSDSGADGCTDLPGAPIDGSTEAVLSPDGKRLYVAGKSTLATLSVGPTGALSYQACLSDTTATGCTDLSGEPLSGVLSVAINPAGNALYTTSYSHDHVARFSIDGSGLPTYQGCYGNDATDSCVNLPGIPLSFARGVIVSPDGGDLYATSDTPGSIVHFTIGAGGALTFDTCLSQTGVSGCIVTSAAPLDNAQGLAISADGSTVWVLGLATDSVLRFRANASGTLSYIDCLSSTGDPSCTPVQDGAFAHPHHIALSPDGGTMYVSTAQTRGVAQLDVGSGGALTFKGCVSDIGLGGCADLPVGPLFSTEDMAVSPDGANLYLAYYGEGALASFFTSPPPDTTAPETTIGKHPRKRTKKRKAKFTFSASEAGATFDCTVDKGSAKPCKSPYVVKFKRGKHTFSVAATDVAGNVDATPATSKWKVKRRKKHH